MSDYKIVDAEKLDADLATVADAIRTKGGTDASLTFPQGFVDAVGAIESGGGGNAEELEMLTTAFALGSTFDRNTVSFNNDNYRFKTIPRLDFSKKTTLVYAISNKYIEYINYYINSSSCLNFNSCLANTTNLKTMVGIDCSSATNITDLYNNSGIETIQEPFNLASVTTVNKAFHADKLKDIRFVENTIKVSITFLSPVLSAESIQSVIDGLATVTTAQTLTLHADVKAKLTDDQKKAISNKNWNLA